MDDSTADGDGVGDGDGEAGVSGDGEGSVDWLGSVGGTDGREADGVGDASEVWSSV